MSLQKCRVEKLLQSKSTKQKIFTVFLGLLLSIILLEISIRIGGFIFLSFQEHRNKLSLIQKDSYRILCLGDSMTAGQYPRLLEQILNEKVKGINFMVIDRAKIGTNSEYTVSTLNENLNKYNPDMVIVMMGFNDEGDLLPYGNIPISKGILFKTYKLARILWYHITNKTRDFGIFTTKEKEKNINTAGEISAKISNFEELEARYIKAIEIDSENDDAYYGLGDWYMIQEEYDKAEAMLKKVININPRNSHAYFRLGLYYRDEWKKQNRYDKAEKMFKKGIEITPENGWAYVELSRLYQKQNRYDKAEEILKKDIEINPEYGWAYFELGRYYMKQNRYDKAEEILKKAININPKNDDAYGSLAYCYEKWGKGNASQKYFKEANRLRLESYNPITLYNYQKLKEIIIQRGIKLVCVQYPMRSVKLLKRILKPYNGITFVDNEMIFKKALRGGRYDEYFMDLFGGDFGHCSRKGNTLIATNIADVILKKCFDNQAEW